LGVGVSLLLLAGAGLSATGASWRVTQGDVSVKCPMTIGGTFDAKTNALSGSLSASAAHPPTLDG